MSRIFLLVGISGIISIILLSYAYSGSLDIALLKTINLNRDTSLDFLFTCITNSASPLAFGIPFLLLAINLVKGNKEQQETILFLIISVFASALVASILKYSIDRPRPFVTYSFLQSISEGGSPSFPSGHTCDAFAMATALSLTYKKWVVFIPVFIWAFAVAYSRMDLGVHYPSDVLGGMVIGSSTAFLCLKIKNSTLKIDV